MDNVNKEVVEFYKKLGYTLIDIKSSVFREEESTLVFQTDNKNHTVDGSTILYDHAVAIHHQLQKAREETIHRILAIVSSKQNQFTSTYERGYQDCVKNILESIHHYQSKLDKPN